MSLSCSALAVHMAGNSALPRLCRLSLARRRTTWAQSPRPCCHAADADDVGFDLAVLVEQNIRHIATLMVVGTEHVGPLEFGRQPLVGLLRRHQLRVTRSLARRRGLGLVGLGRRWRCRGAGRLSSGAGQDQRRRRRAEDQFLVMVRLLSLGTEEVKSPSSGRTRGQWCRSSDFWDGWVPSPGSARRSRPWERALLQEILKFMRR